MLPKSLPMAGGSLPSLGPDTGVTILGFTVDADGTAHLDPNALHGTSAMEQPYTFSLTPVEEASSIRMYVVWVGVRAGFDGKDGYFSAVASPLTVDPVTKAGYRPDTHFTDMIAAIQGSYRLEALTNTQRQNLRAALMSHGDSMWRNRSRMLQELWPD